ncbi:MAG: Wzz/FepE/Etk N-terminal domain-containing protein [Polymorphobacter sp.]
MDTAQQTAGEATAGDTTAGDTTAGDTREGEASRDARLWLAALLATVRARWLLVLGVAATFFVLALVYLWTATYSYTAALRVSAAQTSTARPGLGALGGLAAIAGVGTGMAGETATPFKLYLEGLTSREVATRLSRDPKLMQTVFALEWDAGAQQWREPRSVLRGIKTTAFRLIGLPVYAWQPPNAARLQGFLASNILIDQNIKTPLVTVSINSPDPLFATNFLTILHATNDSFLRQQSRARTEANIAYLTGKLATVSLAEYRKVLFDAIAEQEQQMMLTNSETPYAAEPFGPATASMQPTSPRPLPVLIGTTIAGIIAGLALAILLGPIGRRES